ncbi:MAG TPA: class I lanthipeptide [Thermoanaerobaculia bacterium]|nr:class I lanthipeptide [Thermoanaerobaculia bacterium]
MLYEKNCPKKLTLNRETLRDLTDVEQKAILGGNLPRTGDSVNECCG